MLNGQTVLILEAEFLVALDIQHMLEKLNAGPLLFARSVSEAFAFRPDWPRIDLAIVERGKDSAQTNALLAGLRTEGVTVVLCSSDSDPAIADIDFADLPVVSKPMVEEDFRTAITQALANPARTSGCAS